MDNAVTAALVHRFSCFQALNAEQIAALTAHLEEVRLPTGQVLFKQGDAGDAIYLLVSGQMLIRLGAPPQDDRILATLEPGAIFGEMGPLVNTPRTATAITSAESYLWRFSNRSFQEALENGDAWATSFLLATAQVLGIAPGTVTAHLSRAAAALRRPL